MNQNNLIDLQTGTTIKPGQRLIRIKGGVWLPVGIGSKYTPGSAGTQSATRYYKCASVDTSAKTWTGYRAVLNGGVYTFENTVTTGLSYTSVTPQVGSIYSADALVYVDSLYTGIPTDGLVFYAPLVENKTTAETGQILTKSGDITYSTYGNMPYVQMTKEAAIYTEDTSDIPSGSQCRTWSFYIKFNSIDTNAYFMGLSSKSLGTANWYYFYLNTNLNICLTGYSDDNGFPAVINKDTWYHICLTYCGKVCSAYINGIFASDFATANDLPKTSTYFMMGNTPYHFFNNRAYEGADCCLSSVRIYNRVLNASEIAALASEFTPTQVNT